MEAKKASRKQAENEPSTIRNPIPNGGQLKGYHKKLKGYHKNCIRENDLDLWDPSFETALSILIIPRVISSFLNPIADCDESFNYWEPLHYILYRFGLQTWEYSPVYALRSYLYLIFHAILAKAASFGFSLGVLGNGGVMSKVMIFYGLRGAFALMSAYCEAYFYQSCIKAFGRRTSRYLLCFLILNAGLFHASTAFLPSTFVMYLVMLFMSLWLEKRYFLGIFWGLVAVFCGWPYVGVLFVPFAIETILERGLMKSLLAGFSVGFSVLASEIATNYYFYGRIVVPAWNILVYNVLSNETDSSLYGTEPWTYYVMNLFLNFNLSIVLAAPAVLLLLLKKHYHLALYLFPMYVWLGIMFVQPHKEERFLFPVYPLICLAAATTLNGFVRLFFHEIWGDQGRSLAKALVAILFTIYGVLSISRVTSVCVNYRAPLAVYQHLHDYLLPDSPYGGILSETSSLLAQEKKDTVTLCVSKEWYRFPTSFFFPSNRTCLGFVRSSFRGQLPKPFDTGIDGTSMIPSDMNNQNKEEMSRYVEEKECDYIVDLNLEDQLETKYWEKTSKWKMVHFEWFLDTKKSKSPFRSFYIPFLTPQQVKYAKYAVYIKKK
jgi:alpha-1,2-mannosyltransferase